MRRGCGPTAAAAAVGRRALAAFNFAAEPSILSTHPSIVLGGFLDVFK